MLKITATIEADDRNRALDLLPACLGTVDHEYLSSEQVCERVPGLTVERLKEMRKATVDGPVYVELHAKAIAYDWPDIVAWLESRKRGYADRFGIKGQTDPASGH